MSLLPHKAYEIVGIYAGTMRAGFSVLDRLFMSCAVLLACHASAAVISNFLGEIDDPPAKLNVSDPHEGLRKR